jgi:hypothetical protein
LIERGLRFIEGSGVLKLARVDFRFDLVNPTDLFCFYSI